MSVRSVNECMTFEFFGYFLRARAHPVNPSLSNSNSIAFLAAFESCTLPFEQWTHRAHLRMALLVLKNENAQKFNLDCLC